MRIVNGLPVRSPTTIGVAPAQRIVCTPTRLANGSPALSVRVDGRQFASVPTDGMDDKRVLRLARLCNRLGPKTLAGEA